MPAVRVRFLAPGLFCVLRRPTKNIHEVPMSKSILLSRSARFCAGRVPLPPLLTSAPILGNLSFPKPKEACRSLRQRPTLEKRAAFSVSATERKRAVSPVGCGYILAQQRPDVRETQAASFGPGSVVSVAYVSLHFSFPLGGIVRRLPSLGTFGPQAGPLR